MLIVMGMFLVGLVLGVLYYRKTHLQAPAKPQPARFRLLADRFSHKAGTVVYAAMVFDQCLAAQETASTGIRHVSVTLQPDGGYPTFTVPWNEIELVENPPSMHAQKP